MRALADAASDEAAVLLVGGATAVLEGWRESTVDVDLVLRPERDELLRALPRIKNELNVNVELASPGDFIPLPAGSEDRAVFVAREGKLTFYHFDPYAQALAKLERGHAKDLADVAALVDRRYVEPERALALFAEIEPELYRFPAVDPPAFRRRVEAAFGHSARRPMASGST
jgi:hypothetical protein